MAWKLIKYTLHKGSHCEFCGVGISHNYFISDGERQLRVGYDCCGHFLGIDQMEVAKRIQQLTRLASKDYNRFYNRLPNETLDEYTTRRVNKMAKLPVPT